MTPERPASVTPEEVSRELRRGLHLALLQRTDIEEFIREVTADDVYPLGLVANWIAGGYAYQQAMWTGAEVDAEQVLRQGLQEAAAPWEPLEQDAPKPTVVDISLTVDGEPTDDDRAAAVALVRAGLHEDEVGLGAVLRSVGETGNAAAMFGSVLGMCIKLGVLAFGSIEAFDEELVERLDDLQAREVEG